MFPVVTPNGNVEGLRTIVAMASHDALTILRNSLSAHKLNYNLRASPCAGHHSLSKYDSILRQAIGSVININLSNDQWIQASLPVRLGGLGIRSVSMLAPSAFLASAAETKQIQDSILPSHSTVPDTYVERLRTIWSSLSGCDYPLGPAVYKQKDLDQLVVEPLCAELLLKSSDRLTTVRLLAVAAPHSGDWLKALPMSSCGLRLDDEAIRVAVGLRLGARLCLPHTCIWCC